MFPYISVFGRTIGTYGIFLILSFFFSGFLALRRGKAQGLRYEDLLIIGATTAGFALLCGSGLYVLVTYSAAEIAAMLRQGNLSFLGGGIVFYGGLIGGLLGAPLGIRIAGCQTRLIEHCVVPFIPLGHAIGRIGCVMAGCCHGFAYDGPLALYYPHSLSGLSPIQGYFPVQPLEALVNVGICLILLRIEKKLHRTWDLLTIYLGIYSVSRFFLEMLRGDTIRGNFLKLSTSQWISLLLLIGCVLRLCIHKPAQQHNNG